MGLNDFLKNSHIDLPSSKGHESNKGTVNEPPTEILLGEIVAFQASNSGHVSVFARIEGQGLKGFTIMPNWDIPVAVKQTYFFEVRDVKAYEHQYANAGGVHFFKSSARYIVKAAKTQTQLQAMKAYDLSPN